MKRQPAKTEEIITLTLHEIETSCGEMKRLPARVEDLSVGKQWENSEKTRNYEFMI